MARVLTEGFELGTRPSSWTGTPSTYPTSPVRQNGSGHGGLYCARTDPGSGLRHLAPFTISGTTLYLRVGIRFASVGYGAYFMALGMNGDNQFIYMDINNSGNLRVSCVNSSNPSNWSTQSISVDTWYRIELYANIQNNANGQLILMVNGEIWSTLSGANNWYGYTANTLILHGSYNGYSTGIYTYWDDIAINDATGSFNNTWCGEGYVSLLNITGAGTTTEFTPSTGSNYTCVDDGITTNDADYIYTDTANKIDLYTLANTPASATIIKNLTIHARGTKIGTTVTKGQTVLRTNSTNYFSSDNTLDDFPTYTNFSKEYQSDPNTSAVWTKTNIDAIEIGIKSIA